MTDFLLPAALVILAYIVGHGIGYREGKRDGGPRVYEVKTGVASTVRLHYIGTLKEPQFRAFCSRITNGEPFTQNAFTKPPTRIMSRPQWEGVRDELIRRGLAYRKPDRTTEFTRPGLAFCKWGRGRYERTNDNTKRRKGG